MDPFGKYMYFPTSFYVLDWYDSGYDEAVETTVKIAEASQNQYESHGFEQMLDSNFVRYISEKKENFFNTSVMRNSYGREDLRNMKINPNCHD